MAGLISLATDRLMAISGQPTNAVNIGIAKAEVLGVIDDLNERFHWGVLESKTTVTFAGGTTGHTVSLPDDFASMRDKGIGEYDSENDRIKTPWTKTTQKRFHLNYRGVLSLATSGESQNREWFYVENDKARHAQIRVYPSPASAMIAMVLYYALLMESNIDRFGNSTILVDGAMSRLVKWFPDAIWQAAKGRYEEAVLDRKQKRKSVETGVKPLPNIRIRRANLVARAIK